MTSTKMTFRIESEFDRKRMQPTLKILREAGFGCDGRFHFFGDGLGLVDDVVLRLAGLCGQLDSHRADDLSRSVVKRESDVEILPFLFDEGLSGADRFGILLFAFFGDFRFVGRRDGGASVGADDGDADFGGFGMFGVRVGDELLRERARFSLRLSGEGQGKTDRQERCGCDVDFHGASVAQGYDARPEGDMKQAEEGAQQAAPLGKPGDLSGGRWRLLWRIGRRDCGAG